MFICVFVYGCSRYWFTNATNYVENPLALVAILFGAFGFACFLVTTFLRLTTLSYMFDVRFLQRFHSSSRTFTVSRWGQLPDDCVLVAVALSTGMYLLAQSLARDCPHGTSPFSSQGCNPLKSLHSVTAETMALPMIIVVIFQMLARGCSNAGICLAWSVAIAAVNTSIALSGNGGYLWINLVLAMLMCASYELERVPLRQFIK